MNVQFTMMVKLKRGFMKELVKMPGQIRIGVINNHLGECNGTKHRLSLCLLTVLLSSYYDSNSDFDIRSLKTDFDSK